MPNKNLPSPLPMFGNQLCAAGWYSVEDSTVMYIVISANLGDRKELWSFPSIPSWIVKKS